MGALEVLHGTAADQVSREMKHLAAKLVIVQLARAQDKIRTEKTDESSHPPGILTKTLQGKGFAFKPGRLL